MAMLGHMQTATTAQLRVSNDKLINMYIFITFVFNTKRFSSSNDDRLSELTTMYIYDMTQTVQFSRK